MSTIVVFILVHTGLQAWVESLGKGAAHGGDQTACESAAARGAGEKPGLCGGFIWSNQEGMCNLAFVSQDLSSLTCNMVSPTGLILVKRQSLL